MTPLRKDYKVIGENAFGKGHLSLTDRSYRVEVSRIKFDKRFVISLINNE
jgi:hypothetical protein